MIGEARVTSILAVSLSRVTARGVEITLASAYLFRNESTAFTPSAFKKKVAGVPPTPVAAPIPPAPIREFKTVLTVESEVVVTVRPLGSVVVVVLPGIVVVL